MEPNGNVSHRRFIDDGVLTRKPNQVPKKQEEKTMNLMNLKEKNKL